MKAHSSSSHGKHVYACTGRNRCTNASPAERSDAKRSSDPKGFTRLGSGLCSSGCHRPLDRNGQSAHRRIAGLTASRENWGRPEKWGVCVVLQDVSRKFANTGKASRSICNAYLLAAGGAWQPIYWLASIIWWGQSDGQGSEGCSSSWSTPLYLSLHVQQITIVLLPNKLQKTHLHPK